MSVYSSICLYSFSSFKIGTILAVSYLTSREWLSSGGGVEAVGEACLCSSSWRLTDEALQGTGVIEGYIYLYHSFQLRFQSKLHWHSLRSYEMEKNNAYYPSEHIIYDP